jgi:hypothetical protein
MQRAMCLFPLLDKPVYFVHSRLEGTKYVLLPALIMRFQE